MNFKRRWLPVNHKETETDNIDICDKIELIISIFGVSCIEDTLSSLICSAFVCLYTKDFVWMSYFNLVEISTKKSYHKRLWNWFTKYRNTQQNFGGYFLFWLC